MDAFRIMLGKTFGDVEYYKRQNIIKSFEYSTFHVKDTFEHYFSWIHLIFTKVYTIRFNLMYVETYFKCDKVFKIRTETHILFKWFYSNTLQIWYTSVLKFTE